MKPTAHQKRVLKRQRKIIVSTVAAMILSKLLVPANWIIPMLCAGILLILGTIIHNGWVHEVYRIKNTIYTGDKAKTTVKLIAMFWVPLTIIVTLSLLAQKIF